LFLIVAYADATMISSTLILFIAIISYWLAGKLIRQKIREHNNKIRKYEDLKQEDPVVAQRFLAENFPKDELEILRNHVQTNSATADKFYNIAKDRLRSVDSSIEKLRRDTHHDKLQVEMALANHEKYAIQLRRDIEWASQFLSRR
jgi:hypothetical protein